jgi:uncharacterized protein YkwD
MHWSGCPDPFAAIVHVLTTEDGEDELFRHLSETLKEITATHIGASRVPASEPYAWRWTVFLSSRKYEMQPVPTTAVPGSSLTLVVRFSKPVSETSIICTHPDGRIVTSNAGLSNGRMVAAVEISDRPGTQWIEVVSSDSSGPHVELLFPVEVGRTWPNTWIGKKKTREEWITDTTTAEEFALSLLQSARANHRLPPLTPSRELTEIARSYSAEMASTGRVSHVSPISGTVATRIESAGFAARFAAENIARASTLTDAHEGLMRSPGHRAAILTPRATHVGVGVVTRHSPETGTVHFITQVFALPAL